MPGLKFLPGAQRNPTARPAGAMPQARAACCAALQEVLGTLRVPYQGLELDFESPFRRATMHELVKEATGEPVAACLPL